MERINRIYRISNNVQLLTAWTVFPEFPLDANASAKVDQQPDIQTRSSQVVDQLDFVIPRQGFAGLQFTDQATVDDYVSEVLAYDHPVVADSHGNLLLSP